MEHIGPFLFNGVRFFLAGLWLIPVILYMSRSSPKSLRLQFRKALFPDGVVLGIILFAGASLQQGGIVYTTAGKAGFITGLYVITVPILGIFLKKRSRLVTWIGAVLAIIGLYFLSLNGEGLIPARGDLMVLVSVLFWTLHVHAIDYFVDRSSALILAFMQFMICAALSLFTAVLIEPVHFVALSQAVIPIIYAGIFSAGIGFTLQVVAQREAHPSHATIIMSLESVFAAIGGWIILSEVLSPREMFGCFLMLGGMMVSQIRPRRKKQLRLVE